MTIRGALYAGGIMAAVFAMRAAAEPQYEDDLKAALRQGGRVDCVTCHSAWRNEERKKVTRSLNAFGQDYKKWRKSRQDIAALFEKDSDHDGTANGAELELGAHPGDRRSVPDPNKPATGLDPGGRLTEKARREERSADKEVQRRAAAIQFLLALLRQDEAALGKVVPREGYRELGEKTAMSPRQLLDRWRRLSVTIPAGSALDSFLDFDQARTLGWAGFKSMFPDLEERPSPIDFAVAIPPLNRPEFLKATPVLVMQRHSGTWRIVAGNVLSCWVPGGAASRPAGAGRRRDGIGPLPAETTPSGPPQIIPGSPVQDAPRVRGKARG